MFKTPWYVKVVSYTLLVLLMLFVLVPIWGLTYLAFDGGIKGWPSEFRIWPEQPTLNILLSMWNRPAQTLSFLGLLQNSLLVAGGAAVCAVGLGAGLAYAFARFRFPGRRGGLFALLVGAFLPPIALMTPMFILLTILGIRTTLFGLMIVYTSFAMPFCIWNMRAAFQAVPNELEESAFLDGASHWVAFWWITFPLALPAITLAAIVSFLIGYSEFAMGWLFVQTSDNVTLAMAVSGLLGSGNFSWSNLSAVAIYMILPVVILFLLMQKYLLSGEGILKVN